MDQIRVLTGVDQAVNKVKEEIAKLGGITKDRAAPKEMGGYRFRGIDDVDNWLCEVTARHGLAIYPSVSDREIHFQENPKTGKVQTHVFIVLECMLVSAVDGSQRFVRALGEGIDTGDKGSGKAFSNARKQAMLGVFMVPTHGEAEDIEAHHTQVESPARQDKPGPKKASAKPAKEPATADTIATLAATAGKANTFGVLQAVLVELDGFEPVPDAVLGAVVARGFEIASRIQTQGELKEAKPLTDRLRELGAPDDLARALHKRYGELASVTS